MTQRLRSVHRLLHRFGIDVVRHPGTTSTLGRRLGHFRAWRIDLVVDVGANSGQYGLTIRTMGYHGPIVSIEPLPEAFATLARRTAKDPSWRAIHVALGRSETRAPLFVAENSYSSSLFPTTVEHERAAPAARSTRQVEVEVRRLDAIAGDVIGLSRRPLLKLDAQGSELDILEGAGASLDRFAATHVELSIVPMYAGGPLMADIIDWLAKRGFVLADLEPEFSDPATGRLMQVNGVFYNPAMVTPPGGSGSASA